MLEFIKSWKFMAIIIGLFTAIVVALLVYGITTHTEPGFAAVSPGYTHVDVPIPVCAGGYVPDIAGTSYADSQVTTAINIINTRVGFTLFRMTHLSADAAGHTCTTTVVVGAPTEGHYREPGGDADFVPNSRICPVTIRNTGTDELTNYAIQHELGHCLGLAHDYYDMSIMCGSDPGQPSCTLHPVAAGQYPPRISDSDRALLRTRYLQQ